MKVLAQMLSFHGLGLVLVGHCYRETCPCLLFQPRLSSGYRSGLGCFLCRVERRPDALSLDQLRLRMLTSRDRDCCLLYLH